MPQRLSWTDLASRRVILYGMGREGQASARQLEARGIKFTVVDDQSPLSQAERREGDWVIIKSPGVPFHNPHLKDLQASLNAQITSGLELWLNDHPHPERVVLVTGTKGKSTVSSLIAEGLRGMGKRVFLGGNIGVAPWDPETDAADADAWIIETSSYQAAALSIATPLVAITSLSPDHLPWHGGVEEYYRDKLSLAAKPGVEQVVANGSSDELRRRLAAVSAPVEWIDETSAPHGLTVRPQYLKGAHNHINALMALAVVGYLTPQGDLTAAARAIAQFSGLSHRLEVVHRWGGIAYVDDSLSTNVLSTCSAIEAFSDTPTALIVGGADRGIDYEPLARHLLGDDHIIGVYCTPDNGTRIAEVIRKLDTAGTVSVYTCASLEDAVAQGTEALRPLEYGVVLMSPAAPSFGQFTDYEAKSRAFVAAARQLSAS